MSKVTQTSMCGSCHKQLNELPSLPVNEREPCPDCGSTARIFEVQIPIEIKIRVALDLRQKRLGIGGFLVRQFTGWDLRKALAILYANTGVSTVSMIDTLNMLKRKMALFCATSTSVYHSTRDPARRIANDARWFEPQEWSQC